MLQDGLEPYDDRLQVGRALRDAQLDVEGSEAPPVQSVAEERGKSDERADGMRCVRKEVCSSRWKGEGIPVPEKVGYDA